jgi:uncharacterized membrane protein
MADRVPDPGSSRLPAIDVVRGFVMVLMTLDHASGAFNAHRSMADSAATFRPDGVLEPAQFFVRWVTHLCAPTFVLLAGVSLALSVARRQDRPADRARIDRDILIRGALLVALDAGWTGWMWRLGLPIQLGVLYATGVAMIGLIALRRLPAPGVGALGVAIVVAGELVSARLDPTTALVAASLTGGAIGPTYVLYPFLPWTGFLLIGWAIGARVAAGRMRSRDWLALAAIAAATFAVVRGINGYGNAGLFRRGAAWDAGWGGAVIEWLHVSKYPPSLSYAALELAIAFGLLAAAWRWLPPAAPGRSPWWTPLGVLGQTALFYYLIHAHLIKAVALALGIYKAEGLGATMLGWAGLLVVLYPACRWYRGVKRRHPASVLRFV